MIISIILMFLALIFYTSAIFTERKMGHVSIGIVSLFALGFASDFIGTSIMFVNAKKFTLSLHSTCGYTALLIMSAHLFWAILALKNYKNCERNFTRFSIYAWAVWVIAFSSGIPKVSAIVLGWLS